MKPLVTELAVLLCSLSSGVMLHAQSVIQFSASIYNVTEGTPEVVIVVQRTNDLGTVVGVDFACVDGTATNGLKYTAVSGTLAFGAGETNKHVVVPILNEAFVEGARTFTVWLSNPTGGAVLGGRTSARVSIEDNDTGIQFEFTQYSVAEDAGAVLVGVVRGDDGEFPVTVDYATTNGTAIAGQDYSEAKGTLTFAGGERLKLFNVAVLNDSIKEANQGFRLMLTLSSPSGGGVLGNNKTAWVAILDNDPGVQFEFDHYWIQENEGTITLQVVRGTDVGPPPFTVDYTTSNLTALAGQDYTETKGTLTFAAGETVQSITVPLNYDEQKEGDERFKLTLSNPSEVGLLGARSAATIAILDTTAMKAHRCESIEVQSDRSVQLRLSGEASQGFRLFLDLYPVEVSTNLIDWTPLSTLVRTNALTNALVCTDAGAAGLESRFYRTAGTNLFAIYPPPTGPYAVGTIDRVMTDPSRRNRYGISTNGSFMATFWYPAQLKSGALPAPMFDRALSRFLVLSWQLSPHLAYVQSQAFRERPLATSQAAYPVVIYSCGGGNQRRDNSTLALELASHGYIVVSVDHEDVAYAQLPDGSVVSGTLPPDSIPTYQSRFKDIQIVLDELGKMNAADEMFGSRIDLERIGICGWSTGGVCAAEACLEENRVKVGVLLDPAIVDYVPGLLNFGISRPFLVIIGSYGDGMQLFDKATGTAYWLNITGSSHETMGIGPLLDGGATDCRLAQVLGAYTLSMFDKHLMGRDNHLLDGPNSAYPEVKRILRK